MNINKDIPLGFEPVIEEIIEKVGSDNTETIFNEYLKDLSPEAVKFALDNKNIIKLQIGTLLSKFYDSIDVEQFKGKDNTFKPLLLANYLMKKYHFITDDKTKEIMVYRNGIYEDGGENLIESEIQKILGDETKNFNVRETRDCIKRATYKNPDEFNPFEYVCLENGIYNIKTGVFENHTPRIVFTSKIPVYYDQNAKCDEFEKFVSEIVEDQKAIDTICEMFGYALYKKYSIKHGLFLIGKTDAGKTILLNGLRKFIGDHNISGIKPQNIGLRFQGIELRYKLVNLCDDNTNKPMRDPASYTQATGGGVLSAEIKNTQKQVNFVPYALFINSFNKIPEVPEDTDDAYFNRVCMLKFPYRFVLNPKEENEKQRIRPEILEEKLYTKENMSGIFNWAIVGLKRLLEQGEFSNDIGKDIYVKRAEYMDKTSPVESFYNNIMIFEAGNETPKDLIYDSFLNYVKKNNFAHVSKNVFFEKLNKLLYDKKANGEISEAQRGTGKDRIRVFVGVALRDIKTQATQVKINTNENKLDNYIV